MPFTTPVRYLRRRSAKKQSSKPTAVSKISTRPYIQPQRSCPLFRLPLELRLQIFSYALLAYLDPFRPWSRHTYYYRPNHTHARRITTALLLTCRRIYLETSLLPLEVNEHIVYGAETSHAPPSYRGYIFPHCSLRTVQREAVRRVHVFAQQWWLEGWNERDQWGDFCRLWAPGRRRLSNGDGRSSEGESGLRLEELRITIKHTGWWHYLLGWRSPLALDPRKVGRAYKDHIGSNSSVEENGEITNKVQDLSSKFEEGSWGSRFTSFHHLKTFELELETMDHQRDELDAVVASAQSWSFPLGNGSVLVLEPNATKVDRWKGSVIYGVVRDGAYLPVHDAETTRERTLHGRKRSVSNWMSWVSNRTAGVGSSLEAEEGGGGGPMLEYYVVTLTWRSKRPEDVMALDGRGNAKEGVSTERDAKVQSADVGNIANQHTVSLNTGSARAAGRDAIPSYWG